MIIASLDNEFRASGFYSLGGLKKGTSIKIVVSKKGKTMVQQWFPLTCQEEISINASAECVFEVLSNEANWSTLFSIQDVQTHKKKGRAIFSVPVLGLVVPLNFLIEFTLAESQKPNTVVFQFDQMMKGTEHWSIQADGKRARVRARVEYQVNIGQALDEAASKRSATANTLTGSIARNFMGRNRSNIAIAIDAIVDSASKVFPLVQTTTEGAFHLELANLKVLCENMPSEQTHE